jgi:hypothetical protein
MAPELPLVAGGADLSSSRWHDLSADHTAAQFDAGDDPRRAPGDVGKIEAFFELDQ